MIFCFVLFLAGVLTCALLNISLIYPLSLGVVMFFCLGRSRGYAAKGLLRMGWAKGKNALVIVPVLLLIGDGEQRSGVTGGDGTFLDEFTQLLGQCQQAQGVGNGGTGASDAACCVLLGQAEAVDEQAVALGFLDGV